jgi:hypothetical protein
MTAAECCLPGCLTARLSALTVIYMKTICCPCKNTLVNLWTFLGDIELKYDLGENERFKI